MGGIGRNGEIEKFTENLGIPRCYNSTKKSCTMQVVETLKDKDSYLPS